MLGEHGGFIATAWILGVIVLAGLISWIVIDYRTQRRILSDLETQGIRRRSADQKKDM